MPAFPKPPEHFPGVGNLPAPLRGLIELIYPPEPEILTPNPLVAVGGPSNIPRLKQHGKDLLEQVKRKGLERRVAGTRPETPHVTSAPAELIKALEFAQRKYPRLFGHLEDIRDIDLVTQARTKGVTAGISRPGIHPRKSILELDPALSMGEDADTLGHELLHTADRLTRPDFDQQYNFVRKLPGGYSAMSAEARARNAGESFRRKFEAQAPTENAMLAGLKNLYRSLFSK